MKYICAKTKLHSELLNTIYNLEKKIGLKKTNLYQQDLACHQAILSFLKVQIQKLDHTYKITARQVVKDYGCNLYIFKKQFTQEIQWMTNRSIKGKKQGYHTQPHF